MRKATTLWIGLCIGTLLYYWTPLFDARASIQWDAVDFHYSAQKSFAESLATGLPHWTSSEYSGFPFLADPQAAIWYPPHWPFFLAGINPKSIEWELALHAFIALGGAYLLAHRLTGSFPGSLLAGVFYAGNGFFAGHSSHLGMFETAALAPWLLWAADRAALSRSAGRLALAGSIGALVILAGHFQTALYSFAALAVFTFVRPAPWRNRVAVVLGTVVLGVLLSAVQVLPSLELTAQSVRATTNYHSSTNGILTRGALVSMVFPDHYGVLSGAYHGPADITQFYLYGGMLLIPLGLIAWVRPGQWKIPLALIAPALWYAAGPSMFFYSAVTLLPGFANIRGPIHIWFVVALGLSLAAAHGAKWLDERFHQPWLIGALIAVSILDLWHFNMAINPLAYGRRGFDVAYGDAQARYELFLLPVRETPMYRVWSPVMSDRLGSLNGALESRTEVAYGYNPLELSRYAGYIRKSESNPRLLNGLAVTHRVDWSRGVILPNPEALPRVFAPPHTTFVASADAAWQRLETHDPSQSAIVEGPWTALSCETPRLDVVEYKEDLYRLKYSASGDCLFRFAVPYFPGWTGSIDGRHVDVLPTDYALIGMIVPGGEHELFLHYHSTWFNLGALISASTVAVLSAFLIFVAFSRRPRSAQNDGGSKAAASA